MNIKIELIINIKAVLRKYLWIIDWVILLPIIPASLLMKMYRRIGSKRLPKTTNLIRKFGVFPIIRNYYEPLFETQMLDRKKLISRNLPGLNFDSKIQRSYLNKLDHSNELMDLNLMNESEKNLFFSMDNGSFESGDAEFLYQFIRDVKPQKIIEIGGGQSTKIIQLALRKNLNYFEHYCIEPYEMEWLDNLTGINLIRGKIEDLDFEWSKELKPNDLLFIDSSHIIRPQGDVLFEYLEIIPQLSKGVYIHIHDIYTPRDYPENMLVSEVRFWNEQYLLEAILSNSRRYEVIASLNFLKHNHFSDLKRIAPYLTVKNEPGSIYLKVVN
jgi:hypothetical protein